MKRDLPFLDQQRLNQIFTGVYDMPGDFQTGDRLAALTSTLRTMQQFNYHFRPNDTRHLFDLFDAQFNFEQNSDGTTLWLALILAIQELYGFTDNKLVEVIFQVTVRK